MEVFKCKETKLILALTKNDMQKYQINSKNIIEKNLKTILNDIDNIDSAFINSPKLLVKIFSSKDGGCELFITRLGEPSTECLNYGVKYIYKFIDMSMLLSACKMINNLGYQGSCKIFYEKYGKNKYMVTDKEFSNLKEFNCKECKMITELYLEEHCVPLKNFSLQSLANLI